MNDPTAADRYQVLIGLINSAVRSGALTEEEIRATVNNALAVHDDMTKDFYAGMTEIVNQRRAQMTSNPVQQMAQTPGPELAISRDV